MAQLVANVQEKLRQIDAEYADRRQAVIAESGLPVELLRSVLEDRGLSRPVQSATIRNMPQGHSATTSKKPDKRRKNGEESALYFNPDGLARELGLDDAEGLAVELGQKRATGRSWRLRGYLPPHLHQKIEALKLLRAGRK